MLAGAFLRLVYARITGLDVIPQNNQRLVWMLVWAVALVWVVYWLARLIWELII
jgi:hypothetical protein